LAALHLKIRVLLEVRHASAKDSNVGSRDAHVMNGKKATYLRRVTRVPRICVPQRVSCTGRARHVGAEHSAGFGAQRTRGHGPRRCSHMYHMGHAATCSHVLCQGHAATCSQWPTLPGFRVSGGMLLALHFWMRLRAQGKARAGSRTRC